MKYDYRHFVIFPLLYILGTVAQANEKDISQQAWGNEPSIQQKQPEKLEWKSTVTAIESPINVAVNVPLNGNELTTSAISSASEKDTGEEKGVVDHAEVSDPWERYNRGMYGVNKVLDKYMVRPLAVTYKTVTPEYVQGCVGRFFSNLREPGTAVNQTLQGKPLSGLKTLGRFVVNTTAGIVGFYDPATYIGLPKGFEDFGQTLAVWGWTDSRYFVAPIFGPRTLRDVVGIVGDQPLSPISQVDNSDVALALNVMQLTEMRARMLPYDEVREQAVDEYVMVRDAWMSNRINQIKQN